MPSFSPAVAGYAIVITSAVAFACNNAFAVLAFNGGATPLTTVTVRNVIALAVLALLLKASRGRIALPRRERWTAMGIGVLTGGVAFCLMSAFDLIAVGLAVLIFYLYPIITGLGAWATGQEKLGRGLIAGLVGGFAGLALALEFAGADGSGPGLALAAAAALFMATVVLVSARVLDSGNSRAVTVHMHISASVIFIALSLATGEFAPAENRPRMDGLSRRFSLLYHRGRVFLRCHLKDRRRKGLARHESGAGRHHRSRLRSARTGSDGSAAPWCGGRPRRSHGRQMVRRGEDMSHPDYRPYVPSPSESRVAGKTAREHAKAHMQGPRARRLFGEWAELSEEPFRGITTDGTVKTGPVLAAPGRRANPGDGRGRRRPAGDAASRPTRRGGLSGRFRFVAAVAEHRTPCRGAWPPPRRGSVQRSRSGHGGAAGQPEREGLRGFEKRDAAQPLSRRSREMSRSARRMELHIQPVRRPIALGTVGMAALRPSFEPELLRGRRADDA